MQRALLTIALSLIAVGLTACSIADDASREQLSVASDFMVGLTMDDRARLAASIPESTAARFEEVLAEGGQGAGVGVRRSWEGDSVTVEIVGQDMPFEMSLDDSVDPPVVLVSRGEDRAELSLTLTESGWRVHAIDGHLVEDVVAGLAAASEGD